VVEYAGSRYGTRLSGYMVSGPPGDKCPFFGAGPPGCWTHRTIVLNTRTPVTEWWSVQDFGYRTRLTGQKAPDHPMEWASVLYNRPPGLPLFL
jgi:hypothetical protein